ncbi:8987_t:CDS:1, partial [Funneliformis geosporum]
SREDLTNIVTIAESFYKLNHIKVNWEKSVLMINNARDPQPLICDIN